jgi:hypothetical protein
MQKEVKLDEIIDEQFYCLVAPDGTAQLMTLAPDFQTCVAMIRVMHSKGFGMSFHELCKIKGFQVLPVKVSIFQNGSAEEGFQEAKKHLP